jgi:hypothetical protein
MTIALVGAIWLLLYKLPPSGDEELNGPTYGDLE